MVCVCKPKSSKMDFFSIIAAVCVLSCYIYFMPKGKLASIPGVPLYRSVLGFLFKLPFDEALKFSSQIDLVHRFKVIRAYFQGDWTLMVGCPDLATYIYSDTTAFPKLVPEHHQPQSVFARLTGSSAFFSNGQTWHKHRKSLIDPSAFASYTTKQSTLSPEKLQKIMALMNSQIQAKKGSTVDALDLMQRVTFDCLSQQFLNKNFNMTCSKAKNSLLYVFDEAFKYGFTLATTVFPILQSKYNPFYKHVYQDIDKWETSLKDIITKTRSGMADETEHDFIGKMIVVSEQSQESVEETDKAILDDLKMLFLPSQSLPPAIGAALHFLAQNKDIQDKAFEEVKSVVGENGSEFALTQSQINCLPYLSAIVKETLRLYPTLCPPPKRVASCDVTFKGHFIPKGTHVMIDTFAMQRDPSNWANPEVFDPTRFLDGKSGAGYVPFGAGTRRCPGAQLATHLMLNILANQVSKYQIRYPQPNLRLTLKLKAQVILIPDNLHLNFCART
ncbi:hypothetical protein DSO57_1004355 [Entomophthora muscae]|uniref:Uncharacterized protein n=1 Tax=Entomophthora muscae TaxID=34485 RepID=A0ACC2T7X5_9FUNG|nr:hypothetical protein DSO57_1004355 [Entomophthora muscae]